MDDNVDAAKTFATLPTTNGHRSLDELRESAGASLAPLNEKWKTEL